MFWPGMSRDWRLAFIIIPRKQHSLRRLVRRAHTPHHPSLLGNQDWADAMPCLIFLVAYLERTMWKYSDSNAYRVVLIEAGHIGQNIMLAATAHGLSACPTAALAHSAIHECLGLTRLTHAALYALTLSFRSMRRCRPGDLRCEEATRAVPGRRPRRLRRCGGPEPGGFA